SFYGVRETAASTDARFDTAADTITLVTAKPMGGNVRFGKTENLEAQLTDLIASKPEDLMGGAVYKDDGSVLLELGELSAPAARAVAEAAIEAGEPATGDERLYRAAPVRFGQDNAVVGAVVLHWSKAALHQETYSSIQGLVIVGFAVAMALGLLMTLLVKPMISAPLKSMTWTVGKLAQGEDVPIAGEYRRDEIGVLAKAFRKVHEQGVTARRIERALESSSSMTMIADGEGKIVYLNRQLQRLFTEAQGEIRRALPRFDAAKIEGGELTDFEHLPALREAIAAGRHEMKQAVIPMGSYTFSLSIGPVFSDQQRIGTVVEWRDVTAEMRATGAIDAVIAAAVEGDFSARVDMAGLDGAYETIGGRLNELAALFDTSVTEASRAVAAMADGDLSSRMQGSYQGALADLQSDLNRSIERLSTLVGQIGAATQGVEQGSGEISQSATDLSRRAERQAATLEETAANMEEVSVTTRTNAQGAGDAKSMSDEAAQRAVAGAEVVDQTVAAMERIAESSKKITHIVGLIDSIAFQTNLLALNAAVEAARAGDAGKGFAVVASEVRTLAQRSAEAAQDIKGLVEESSGHV
ncbi:MAG: methyl-accepting chemotaxis protein, partial [Pseudomonadota bacterium]